MPNRIHVLTVASIGIFAFGLEAVVHEVLGHGVVCWLTGGRVVLISSTAMQTASTSRLVSAAGPLANILFGFAALAPLSAFARRAGAKETRAHTADVGATRIKLTSLFLYFFAFANLFLATGYILYSGLINFGDFAAVVAGLHPAWLYRAALVAVGALGYRYGIAQAARFLSTLIFAPPSQASPQSPPRPAAPISFSAARRIVYTACFAGGGLFLLASIFNPISPSLILYDGLSGAIGLTLGFFLALTDLRQSSASPSGASSIAEPKSPAAPVSLPLTIAAAIFAIAFLIFMGKGIRPS
ncbi:MAG TPA: hypothetical protein VMP12_11145 [Candidatus Sulfotelmatobacter sp.]|nr:hypothetical protein [Candidatus Sulfotelmatobacter sp.]